jgi:hypothetical protein
MGRGGGARAWGKRGARAWGERWGGAWGEGAAAHRLGLLGLLGLLEVRGDGLERGWARADAPRAACRARRVGSGLREVGRAGTGSWERGAGREEARGGRGAAVRSGGRGGVDGDERGWVLHSQARRKWGGGGRGVAGFDDHLER